RAVKLAPDYPENRLNLAEAHLKWLEMKSLQDDLRALEELWPEARKEFAGPEWETDWADWEKRLKALKRKVEESAKPRASPRQTNSRPRPDQFTPTCEITVHCSGSHGR